MFDRMDSGEKHKSRFRLKTEITAQAEAETCVEKRQLFSAELETELHYRSFSLIEPGAQCCGPLKR